MDFGGERIGGVLEVVLSESAILKAQLLNVSYKFTVMDSICREVSALNRTTYLKVETARLGTSTDLTGPTSWPRESKIEAHIS